MNRFEGYIVKNANGDYLAKGLYWYPHEKDSDAWVHPENIKSQLKDIGAFDWDIPPVEFISMKIKGTWVCDESFVRNNKMIKEFTKEELNLFRQWYNAVEDLKRKCNQ